MDLNVITANRACAILYSYVQLKKKGFWLIPVNVCPDIPLTLCAAKIPFEFVDISPSNLCIDEKICLELLSKHRDKYTGIIYVRTYGNLYDSSQFFDACRTLVPNIAIVDDRCLCLPSVEPEMYNADLILYSTGHCKQIDLGGGGYAFSKEKFHLVANMLYDGTNQEIIYKQAYKEDKIIDVIPFGWLEVSEYKDWGLYENIIQSHIPERIIKREKLNCIYRNNLIKDIQFRESFQQWRFNVRVTETKKEVILNNLFSKGLFASNHYRCASKLFNNREYPNAVELYNTTINLFNDENYTEEMALQTCSLINKVLSNN